MNRLQHILLIEDNTNDIELTLMVLQEFNLANEIIVLQDGNLAYEYLKTRASKSNQDPLPIMVLLDLNLPGKDGREILKAMKEDEYLKSIPVIMLTSSREEADFIESHRLGADEYISKPLNFFQFAEIVARLGCGWGIVTKPLPHHLNYR